VLVELRGMMCVDLDGQSDLELPASALAIRRPAGKGVGHRPGAPMETSAVDLIATAVAPIVMVSATGLLFIGVQTKNLHLADRVRDLMREYREAISRKDTERREALRAQIVLFERRIRLSQRALELTAGIFLLGIASLLLALVLEFLEMRAGSAPTSSRPARKDVPWCPWGEYWSSVANQCTKIGQ
jgi:hypothetical protein